MSVPLLQNLYMSENNVDYVEMFAVAFIPKLLAVIWVLFDMLERPLKASTECDD
jgi:23S rRNA C2498 (ribose-2'-O)-methylase RlmM